MVVPPGQTQYSKMQEAQRARASREAFKRQFFRSIGPRTQGKFARRIIDDLMKDPTITAEQKTRLQQLNRDIISRGDNVNARNLDVILETIGEVRQLSTKELKQLQEEETIRRINFSEKKNLAKRRREQQEYFTTSQKNELIQLEKAAQAGTASLQDIDRSRQLRELQAELGKKGKILVSDKEEEILAEDMRRRQGDISAKPKITRVTLYDDVKGQPASRPIGTIKYTEGKDTPEVKFLVPPSKEKDFPFKKYIPPIITAAPEWGEALSKKHKTKKEIKVKENQMMAIQSQADKLSITGDKISDDISIFNQDVSSFETFGGTEAEYNKLIERKATLDYRVEQFDKSRVNLLKEGSRLGIQLQILNVQASTTAFSETRLSKQIKGLDVVVSPFVKASGQSKEIKSELDKINALKTKIDTGKQTKKTKVASAFLGVQSFLGRGTLAGTKYIEDKPVSGVGLDLASGALVGASFKLGLKGLTTMPKTAKFLASKPGQKALKYGGRALGTAYVGGEALDIYKTPKSQLPEKLGVKAIEIPAFLAGARMGFEGLKIGKKDPTKVIEQYRKLTLLSEPARPLKPAEIKKLKNIKDEIKKLEKPAVLTSKEKKLKQSGITPQKEITRAEKLIKLRQQQQYYEQITKPAEIKPEDITKLAKKGLYYPKPTKPPKPIEEITGKSIIFAKETAKAPKLSIIESKGTGAIKIKRFKQEKPEIKIYTSKSLTEVTDAGKPLGAIGKTIMESQPISKGVGKTIITKSIAATSRIPKQTRFVKLKDMIKPSKIKYKIPKPPKPKVVKVKDQIKTIKKPKKIKGLLYKKPKFFDAITQRTKKLFGVSGVSWAYTLDKQGKLVTKKYDFEGKTKETAKIMMDAPIIKDNILKQQYRIYQTKGYARPLEEGLPPIKYDIETLFKPIELPKSSDKGFNQIKTGTKTKSIKPETKVASIISATEQSISQMIASELPKPPKPSITPTKQKPPKIFPKAIVSEKEKTMVFDTKQIKKDIIGKQTLQPSQKQIIPESIAKPSIQITSQDIKQIPKLKPSTIEFTPSFKIKEKETQTQKQIAPSRLVEPLIQISPTKFRYQLGTKPIEIPTLKTPVIEIEKTKQPQKTASLLKSSMMYGSTTMEGLGIPPPITTFDFPPPPPPPPPPKIGAPLIPAFGYGEGVRKRKGKFITFPTPSLKGFDLGLKAPLTKAARKKIYSGLEIRPLYVPKTRRRGLF